LPCRRAFLFLSMLSVGFLLSLFRHVSADEWQPVSPEELKMTSVPEAPAVILYRQVDRDDSGRVPHEYNYVRIKILTDEGRKYADVEIPFFKGEGNISNLRARTVRQDGSVANFEGRPFEKTIVKAKGLKYLAKTFTLPDAQVGSIIEYHYVKDLQEGYVFNSRWILSDELFTKHAKFSLKPSGEFALRWSWPIGLPNGTQPPKDEHGVIRLDTQNVPAFQIEDFMPPENELKYRVDFAYYENNTEKEPDKFWKSQGKKFNGAVENFLNKRKAMEQAVSQIVSPGDAPEVKLQKIYARAQQFRNTSYELEKTEQEQKRDKQKEINNVEDLWKLGYGNGRQINWLFLALARGAGFEAYSVYISARSQYFFNPAMMNPAQLNGDVVLVKLNGKDFYCDPGSKFAPFGVLPWEETAVKGLRLDKDGGTWVTTTIPESSDSRIERKADLKLEDDGTLSGKVTVTFSGMEALTRRAEERDEDDANRKKFLEDQLKEYIPVGIDVELTNKPDWNSSASTLVATYDLKVPGWVSGSGRHALFPVGLFSAPEKQLFDHSNRVHPVYFSRPFEELDDISIQLPFTWTVSSVPKPINQDVKAIVYQQTCDNDKGVLHLSRTLRSNVMIIEPKLYPALRNFYQNVRSGDEQQIIMQPLASTTTK
jgi:Domain of Unknown Function with PDB structure (DUF3857)